MSQSILEILKTITIVIVFKISKMDCDSILLPVFRALVFGLALCFEESINLT